MSTRDLKTLLDEVPDTRELVLRSTAPPGPSRSAIYDAWNDAHDEAETHYRWWRGGGGRDAYCAYRAAQDREDAAQDALAVAPV